MSKQIVRGIPFFPVVSKDKPTYAPLQKNISTDVVIIGGGVTGALCAYYFSMQNIQVTLIEKNKVSQGSTAITTSLLQYELDGLIQDLEKNYPLERIIKGYRFSEDGLIELENLIKDLNVDCQFKKRDCLLYTNDRSKIEKVKYEYEKRKQHGFDVTYIDNSTHQFDFSFDIQAGVYAHHGGAEINPVQLTYTLLSTVKERGGEIYEETEVVEFISTPSSVLVKTNAGYHILAKKMIIATGYDVSIFTNKKYASLSTTYNIVTSPIQNLTGWHNQCLIKTAEDTYTYLRTTLDNRMIIGGKDTKFIPEMLENSIGKMQYNKLEEQLQQMFPQLSYGIDYRYNGVFGTTKDNLAYIGPDPKDTNIWYCLGYGANGILFAANGARMLSKLYKGEIDERLALVALDRE